MISQLEVCQEEGVKKGGTWMTLRVPDRRHGGHGHSWCHEWCLFIPRKIPWKFRVDISIRSVSGRGGQEGGDLEDIEGSWLEIWRTWSFLTSWMMFFYPKEDTLKISCWYLNWKCFLTRDMEDRVILDTMDDLGGTQGSYPEGFMSLSLFLAEI